MYDTLTGTNWAADATKGSVIHAARGETAPCMLLCKKREVRRLSEQGQDQGALLAFLSSYCLRPGPVLRSDRKLQKLVLKSGRGYVHPERIQNTLEVSCKSTAGDLSAAVFGTACW